MDINPPSADQTGQPHTATPVITEESEIGSNPAIADQTIIDSNPTTADQTKTNSNQTKASQEDSQDNATPIDREESKIDTNAATANQIDLTHGGTLVDTEESGVGSNPAIADQTIIDSKPITAVQEDPLDNTTPVDREESKIDSNPATADQVDPPHSATPVNTDDYKIYINPATADQIEPPHSATPVDAEESKIGSNPATADQIDPPHGATPVNTVESKIDTNPVTAGQEDSLHNTTPVDTKESKADSKPATADPQHSATPVDAEKSKIGSNPASVDQDHPLQNATPVEREGINLRFFKIDSNTATDDQTKIDSNPARDDQTKIHSNPTTADQKDSLHYATPFDKEESKIDTNPSTADQSKINSNPATADQENPLPNAPVDAKQETDDQKDDLQSSTVDIKEPPQNETPFDRDESKIHSRPATVDQKDLLQSVAPVYTKAVDQKEPLQHETPSDKDKSLGNSESATANKKQSSQIVTPIDTKTVKAVKKVSLQSPTFAKKETLQKITLVNTDKGRSAQIKPQKNGIHYERKLLKPRRKSLQNKTYVIKDKSVHGTEPIKEPEKNTRSTDIETEAIEPLQLVKDVQKDLHRNSTPEAENSKLDNLQEVKTTQDKSFIFVADTNKLLQKLETGEGISLFDIIVPMSPNLSTTIENLIGQGKHNPKQVHFTSTTSEGFKTQCHSNVTKAPINQNERGVEREVVEKEEIVIQGESSTVAQKKHTELDIKENVYQTKPVIVSQTEKTMVRKGGKKESLVNYTLSDKDATVALTESAMVCQYGVSADHLESVAEASIDENEIDEEYGLKTEPETKINQPGNGTELMIGDEKREIVIQTELATVAKKKDAELEIMCNKDELESETGKMTNQIVDDTESAMVGQYKEKEPLENTLLDKNETVVLTESAMVDHNKLSADGIDSAAFDDNTELGQDTEKIAIDSETGSHKLQREFTSGEEDLALEDMMSLLWPNFSTTAIKTLIGLMKNNNAQVSSACSTSRLENQQANNGVIQAPINKDENGLEKQPEIKVDQPVDGTETTTMDKKKTHGCCNTVETSSKNGIHAKWVTVDGKGGAKSKIINVKGRLERKTGTTTSRTGADKKEEIVYQTVTVNQNENTPGTKIYQSVDGAELTKVEKKGETVKTNSCLPFMVNSCRLTVDKKITDEKELDFHDLQAWCTITSSYTRPDQTKSTQAQIHKNEHCRPPISQASNNEKLVDPVYETLRFHSVHGKNIVLSCSNFMAQREKAANFLSKGIAFSCRPVRINEKVCLRMENLSDYKYGVITFGFTNIDPQTLIGNLPDSAITDLTELPGFWAHRLEKSWCEKNNILNYQVNKSGNVLYGINNVEKGALYWGIDTSKSVWGFIDIIGYFTALKFTSIKEDRKPSITAPLPRLKYQIQFQPFVPSKLHVLKGDNIDFLGFKGVVAKSDKKFNKGYVFSKHPIRPGQTIVVQILSTGAESEFLPLGLTTCDPATLTLIDLPDDAENLTDNSEYWLVYKNTSNCLENGDELAITMTRKEEIQLTKNDNDPVTVKQLKKSEKFWAFVQIYGSIKMIRMWSTVRGPPRVRYSVK